MQVTDEMKKKYKPFDWSQHDPAIFGHVDDEMRPYVTGQKSREWEEKHGKITVAEDPLHAKPKETKQQKTASKIQPKIEDTSMSVGAAIESPSSSILDTAKDTSSNIKVYDEALSEHGATTTLPPRKTKRSAETQQRIQSELGFDEQAYKDSQAPEPPSNPFQPILDKIELQEMRGGTGANIDFTDLIDVEHLRAETAFEDEEIWQARTKDGILIS